MTDTFACLRCKTELNVDGVTGFIPCFGNCGLVYFRKSLEDKPVIARAVPPSDYDTKGWFRIEPPKTIDIKDLMDQKNPGQLLVDPSKLPFEPRRLARG